jgi:hypothetical protein
MVLITDNLVFIRHLLLAYFDYIIIYLFVYQLFIHLFIYLFIFLFFFIGVKHIQELVEVNVLDDFSEMYDSKITEMVEEITEKILSRMLYDCSNSCDELFNR